MRNAAITLENADSWAVVFELINLIESLQTIDDFYNRVVPPCRGLKEVYDRLTGWRKRAFKAFIMSGSFVLSKSVDGQYRLRNWSCGQYDKNSRQCSVTVYTYPEQPAAWSDYSISDETWRWSQLCAALPI